MMMMMVVVVVVVVVVTMMIPLEYNLQIKTVTKFFMFLNCDEQLKYWNSLH
jgi:hypothetical protein